MGIWFRFSTDARLKIAIEFYDDQSGYERGSDAVAASPSGMSDSGTEAVWGSEHGLQRGIEVRHDAGLQLP